jgi:hypothetical protein
VPGVTGKERGVAREEYEEWLRPPRQGGALDLQGERVSEVEDHPVAAVGLEGRAGQAFRHRERRDPGRDV